MGLAIGKSGSKIKKAERMVGKNIEVVEHSDNPETFMRNILVPAKVKSVSITERDERKVAVVAVELEDKKIAIGRKGRKIQNAKRLAERHHDIRDVILR
jgi:N utilization substance protein A